MAENRYQLQHKLTKLEEKNQFAFEYRGEMEAKNKDALKMHFVKKQYETSKAIT